MQRMMQREQDGVRCRISEANRNLTWDDTRLMPLTSRVSRVFAQYNVVTGIF